MDTNLKLEQIAVTSRDGERLDPTLVSSKEDFVSFLKHLKAYDYLRNFSTAKNCLEIGCGTGYGTKYVAEFLEKITAIEVDQKLVQSLSTSINNSNISFSTYNGKNLPFSDNEFDLIFSFQVIEHINNDIGYLKEIKRVLKAGGVAIITTPNRLYRLKDGQRPFNRFHVREYSPQTLADLVMPIFSNTKYMGIFGNEAVQKVEHHRVKAGLSKYDPFNLRRFLPSALVTKTGRTIKSFFHKEGQQTEDFKAQFNLESLFVSSEDLNSSLDLLICCKK